MKKNALWWIIGLMSVALLGIIIMQAYWINQSIKLSEEHFEKNIYSALNSVVGKLELAEIYETTTDLLPRSFADFSDKEKDQLYEQATRRNINVEFAFVRNIPPDSFLVFEEDALFEDDFEEKENMTRQKVDAHIDLYYQRFSQAFASRSTCRKPLPQRINLNKFDKLLKEELNNQGVDIDYFYGIYSEIRNAFVVTNSYVCSDDAKPEVLQANLQDLSSSRYRVRLFPSDIDVAGYLLLHFPNKEGYMWRSVLPMLLGAVLFSGIILFCFAYTIQVIFEQKKLSEIKNDFINNMTHEFKTPIATISVAADSISLPSILNRPDKIQRFANIIKQENKRMNKQVEKVLNIALLDKKDVKLSLKPLDIHDIIERAVDNLSLQVDKKGGEIVRDLRATNSMIEADETHISNVIHNLLDNANKYTPENPLISVHTRNVDNGIQIMVKDNGVGMSKEQRKRIFDKFYRVHTGNRHDVKGFGLGLSYVKAIVGEHKGDITVRSELGKGSRFILFFKHKVG